MHPKCDQIYVESFLHNQIWRNYKISYLSLAKMFSLFCNYFQRILCSSVIHCKATRKRSCPVGTCDKRPFFIWSTIVSRKSVGWKYSDKKKGPKNRATLQRFHFFSKLNFFVRRRRNPFDSPLSLVNHHFSLLLSSSPFHLRKYPNKKKLKGFLQLFLLFDIFHLVR